MKIRIRLSWKIIGTLLCAWGITVCMGTQAVAQNGNSVVRLSDVILVENNFNNEGGSNFAPTPINAPGIVRLPPSPSLMPGGSSMGDFRTTPLPYADPVQHDSTVPEPGQGTAGRLTEGFFKLFDAPAKPFAKLLSRVLKMEHFEHTAALNDQPIGIQPIPERPPLIVELNEDFLGPGFLDAGIELPSGAIWRPALWVFGTYRNGLSYSENSGPTFTESAQRLNLFAQLNLSGTERFVVGMRPLDQEQGRRREFNGYDYHGGDSIDGWNSDVQTLFFEGDLGELFPNLDPYDTKALDYGFSVGRQPMSFQQGLLINEDMLDAVTATRNTLYGGGNLNLRATGVYAWNRINRNNNMADRNAQLVGLFTESDYRKNTINFDLAYLHSQTQLKSLAAVGLSGIRRFHGTENTYNSSLHILASFPTEGESIASRQGELLFSQFSWTRHHSEDIVYMNAFWAIDQFTSPARGPLAGGPLGQTGILFASPSLGQFGAPLSNQASDAFGGSLGYQMFFAGTRRQVVLEFGGRKDTNGIDAGAIATGLRYQQAFGQHWIMIVDGFLTKRESVGLAPGARLEFLAKF